MPDSSINAPVSLMKLANHALVIIFLKTVEAYIKGLFTEEIEFHPFGQSPFLSKMSQDLWKVRRGARKHKAAPLNTDRGITDIVDYVDECVQRAECGYFFRSEFIEEIGFMSTRLRALLDLQ